MGDVKSAAGKDYDGPKGEASHRSESHRYGAGDGLVVTETVTDQFRARTPDRPVLRNPGFAIGQCRERWSAVNLNLRLVTHPIYGCKDAEDRNLQAVNLTRWGAS